MSDAERLADAAGEGVKVVVEHSRLGRNQFLMAVLTPTLALVSVAAGIFATGRSEEQARNREAEIQRSELVLPVYQDVVRQTEQLDAALDSCDDLFAQEYEVLVERIAEQCQQPLDKAFDDLDEAINVALLVSDDELKQVADDFETSQEEFEQVAAEYNNLDAIAQLSDADFEALANDYDEAKEHLEGVRDRLIETARTQVLKPTQ